MLNVQAKVVLVQKDPVTGKLTESILCDINRVGDGSLSEAEFTVSSGPNGNEYQLNFRDTPEHP